MVVYAFVRQRLGESGVEAIFGYPTSLKSAWVTVDSVSNNKRNKLSLQLMIGVISIFSSVISNNDLYINSMYSARD